MSCYCINQTLPSHSGRDSSRILIVTSPCFKDWPLTSILHMQINCFSAQRQKNNSVLSLAPLPDMQPKFLAPISVYTTGLCVVVCPLWIPTPHSNSFKYTYTDSGGVPRLLSVHPCNSFLYLFHLSCHYCDNLHSE